MKIYKVAQAVEMIVTEDVEYIVQSFGTKRFSIGYRKEEEVYLKNYQRGVRRPYTRENEEGTHVPHPVPEGLLTVFDLQIAAKLAREALNNPNINEGNIDVNDYDPAILKGAYRRIYPENVEYIKGGGKVYVVYGTDWEDEFGDV